MKVPAMFYGTAPVSINIESVLLWLGLPLRSYLNLWLTDCRQPCQLTLLNPCGALQMNLPRPCNLSTHVDAMFARAAKCRRGPPAEQGTSTQVEDSQQRIQTAAPYEPPRSHGGAAKPPPTLSWTGLVVQGLFCYTALAVRFSHRKHSFVAKAARCCFASLNIAYVRVEYRLSVRYESGRVRDRVLV